MTTAIITVSTTTSELTDAISGAYASRSEIIEFLHGVRQAGLRLDADAQKAVKYALARDAYRSGDNMQVRDLAILAHTTVEKIQHFVKKLYSDDVEAGSWVSNNTCSAVMCNMMEM